MFTKGTAIPILSNQGKTYVQRRSCTLMFIAKLFTIAKKQEKTSTTFQIMNAKPLLLSCLSRVRLCTTPQMAAHQAPPSLGFSRQEYWSGLPFPSPMHESEKSLSHIQLLETPWTAAYQAPLSMGFSRQEYWSGVPLPSLQIMNR